MLNILKHITLFGPGFSPGIRPVLFIFNLLSLFYTAAQQNLVPNGSFEEYYSCPTAPGSVGDNQLEKCKYWYKPSLATSDYYNACQTDETTGVSVPNNWFGKQFAKDGNAYIGIGVYQDEFIQASEYVQIKLEQPLEKFITYQIAFYCSLADYSSRATSVIGARLDNLPISPTSDMIGFELPPHTDNSLIISDTTNWVKISGLYCSKGGEQYLTIGRFIDTSIYNNNNIPYLIVACNPCFSGENTAHYYIDMVSLIEISSCEIDIPNVFTPNNDGINDFWTIPLTGDDNEKVYIVNRWGNLIYENNLNDFKWDGRTQTGKECASGVYFYKVSNSNRTGFIHLIR